MSRLTLEAPEVSTRPGPRPQAAATGGRSGDSPAVLAVRVDALPAGLVPQLHRLVIAGRHDEPPVGGEPEAGRARVAPPGETSQAPRHLPRPLASTAHCLILGTRRPHALLDPEGLTLGARLPVCEMGQACHGAVGTARAMCLLSALRWPEAHRWHCYPVSGYPEGLHVAL